MINNIIYSQILRRLLKSKESYIAMWLITCISSFMFFFVQSSIDANRQNDLIEKFEDLVVALDSNTILARTFLILFMFILAFLYYMFFHKFIKNEARAFGCFISLGIEVKTLKKIYFNIVGFTVITSTIVGNVLGYIFSDILLNNYIINYGVMDLKKGLAFSNIFMGYMFPIITVLIVAFINVHSFFYRDIIDLLDYKDEKNLITIKVSNYISKFFSGNFAFGMRIAFRKPFYLFMIIGAIFIFGTLFLFSISLNVSSNIAQGNLLIGRNYEYEIKFDYMKNLFNSNIDSEEISYIIETEASLIYKDEEISQICYGIEPEKKLFQLIDNDNSIIDLKEGQIIISPRISLILGINKGDNITININGNTYQFQVQGVGVNAYNNGIYLLKTDLVKMFPELLDTYNLVYTNLNLDVTDGVVISKDIIRENIDRENVSNRISAVICQALAVIVGTLLLFLAIFMNFEENHNNILRLNILGYNSKEINSMIVSIYEPIIIIGFLIMIYPTVLIGKKISILLSMQTGDYIPFYTDIWVVILNFIFIFILYIVIKSIFTWKIKKINDENKLLKS